MTRITDNAPGLRRADFDLPVPYAPPETALQIAIAGCFSEALNLDRVGLDDDFFDLGGDSLAAERLYLLARERDLPAFPIVKLLTLGCVRKLAEWAVSNGSAEMARENLDNLG